MYIISLLIIVLDQLVKHLIRSNMTVRQSIPIIKNVLHISYVKNTGMAFGMFPGMNIIFLIIATLVVLTIVILEIRGKIKTKVERIFFGMILGGAVGNLIDRYIRGYITDFVDFRVFPVFNVADACVCVGAFLLFIVYFRKKPETVENKEDVLEEKTPEPDENSVPEGKRVK